MLSVKEAQAQILQHFSPLATELILLEDALGRILAENMTTSVDLPPFDNSSVDGFAICSVDLPSARSNAPVQLPVIGDIPAGTQPTFQLVPGQSARIMTGAPLPAGADAVVMVEDTDFNNRAAGVSAPAHVKIYRTIKTGENIRPRGMDLQAGQQILKAGQTLRAQDVGMLAMVGVAQVNVHRKPLVAILSTGDEVLPVAVPLTPGKIHDTNSYTLAALAQKAGCNILRLGIAADTREAVQEKLNAAHQAGADVILSSAGVSVGAFDYVKDVVESDGALDFWKVNMRPGKPLAFGSFRGIPFFGLPGNPVSAFVGFFVFVEPALSRLRGIEAVEKQRVSAILAEGLESDGRESYLRATITLENGHYTARFSTNQNSGNLFSLVESNALLIIPSGVKSCPPKTEVEALLLP